MNKLEPEHTNSNAPLCSKNTLEDEIDLIEFFLVIWKQKLIISLSVVTFFLGSIAYNFYTPERWSAKIQVIPPSEIAFKTYKEQGDKFKSIYNDRIGNSSLSEKNDFEKPFNSSFIFERFIFTFNDTTHKLAFLNSQRARDIIQKFDGTLDEKLIRQLVLTLAVSPLNTNAQTLTIESSNKESSSLLLTAYIDFIAQSTHVSLMTELSHEFNIYQNTLERKKIYLNNDAKNKIQLEIRRAKYELIIAKAAGVVSPIPLSRENQLFNIDLGSKGIEAKIAVLKSIENFSFVSPSLQKVETKLLLLSNLKVDSSIQFEKFQFLGSSEPSVSSDNSKKTLLVIISTILGGIFGVMLALIMYYFRKRNR